LDRCFPLAGTRVVCLACHVALFCITRSASIGLAGTGIDHTTNEFIPPPVTFCCRGVFAFRLAKNICVSASVSNDASVGPRNPVAAKESFDSVAKGLWPHDRNIIIELTPARKVNDSREYVTECRPRLASVVSSQEPRASRMLLLNLRWPNEPNEPSNHGSDDPAL
jgi:hypothetical protein